MSKKRGLDEFELQNVWHRILQKNKHASWQIAYDTQTFVHTYVRNAYKITTAVQANALLEQWVRQVFTWLT